MTELASATASRSIVIEREMPHPPEKIWRALTLKPADRGVADEERLPAGRGPSSSTSAPRPCRSWNGVTDCEVLIVEPNKRLSYSWNASGEEAANGLKTIVDLDADADQRRHARAHGAVGLQDQRRRGFLPGRDLRLAADGRQPGASSRRAGLNHRGPPKPADGASWGKEIHDGFNLSRVHVMPGDATTSMPKPMLNQCSGRLRYHDIADQRVGRKRTDIARHSVASPHSNRRRVNDHIDIGCLRGGGRQVAVEGTPYAAPQQALRPYPHLGSTIPIDSTSAPAEAHAIALPAPPAPNNSTRRPRSRSPFRSMPRTNPSPSNISPVHDPSTSRRSALTAPIHLAVRAKPAGEWNHAGLERHSHQQSVQIAEGHQRRNYLVETFRGDAAQAQAPRSRWRRRTAR